MTPRRVVVVTGTDTGVGKTVATAALAATAPGDGGRREAGADRDRRGPTRDVSDVDRLTGLPVQEFTALDDPLAPDTAARRQGVPIPRVAEYVDRILALSEQHDTVLVEGAGGLLVRLDTDGGTLLDLVRAAAGLPTRPARGRRGRSPPVWAPSTTPSSPSARSGRAGWSRRAS